MSQESKEAIRVGTVEQVMVLGNGDVILLGMAGSLCKTYLLSPPWGIYPPTPVCHWPRAAPRGMESQHFWPGLFVDQGKLLEEQTNSLAAGPREHVQES